MPPAVRILILVIIALAAMLIASWTGFLVWLRNGEPVDAIIQAGVAFAGTVGLSLTVWAAYRQK